MKFSTLCAAVAGVLTAATLAGCSGSGSTAASGSTVVGVDYPRSDTDFWNAYIKYAPQFATQLGLDIKTTNSQNDIANLTANVQTMISQGVKGVVMAPQDTAAVIPTLQQLATKKIPVVSVDTRPDQGNVYMVVRADNRAYGEKACRFLGTKLAGKGKVVMLEGGLDSINGRDRTDAFNECMKTNFPGITVFGEATNWDANTAAQKLQTRLTANPDIKGVYMESSFALAGTLQLLKQRGVLVPAADPKHVFIVSNDGIAEELDKIRAGEMDATVSQPADLFAKYALQYIKDAIAGKTPVAGKTDHDSTILQIREGLMEDQLAAPLVTADGATFGPVTSVKVDDQSLWGNSKN
ncbi:sugar ABC transporter substrate-binding protein [Amycolatopsis sp. RTGN1]|uniref:sugar ABC transporter substrate-binding protein n=1 Tax=Amycolatopsis ponsaeliensis TaxID=2992142 RepID=UPI0025516B97|nr:sugar ABC transporter substrate-binding protein [Amycolatopsis sp. RTGN1]